MEPLTPAELRAAIYVRIGVACACCNTHRRNRQFGQIQGMLYALTGEVHHVDLDTPTTSTLTAAGIPFVERPDGVLETPDEWMKEHGFEQEPDGSYGNKHPIFGESW
jgi:hypothetical protein